ncbi:hypothetical protein TNCV_308951 [Trichonephila clavipes]|nr:hypothetical protein TNCV_308951 [Trichonephila clavipes]
MVHFWVSPWDGAEEFLRSFSFYCHVGSPTTHYDGEIDAVHLTRLSTPDKAVILSDSCSVIQALASNLDKFPEPRIAGSC